MRFPLAFLWFAAVVFARDAHVTVLATTDLHGNLYPWDYLTAKPSDRGLAKVATLVQAERKSTPDALLLDAGDTIQGAPIESVWQSYVRTGKLPFKVSFQGSMPHADPMMLAMNFLRYDGMTVGNHEFNYGLRNLDKARSEAKFPWLSANTRLSTGASAGRKPFQAYIIRTVSGVKVAVVGVTTPTIPAWEKEENYRGYTFIPAVTALSETVAELRRTERPDLVIVLCHAGLDRDLKTGVGRHGEMNGENIVYDLATRVPGIDAIIFGHTHSELEDARVNGVLLTQPKNWGMSLARLDFELESKDGAKWEVRSKKSRLIPVRRETAADPEVLRIARPYHEATEQYLNTVVAQSAATMTASRSRIEDTPIIDAVQSVQLAQAKADVSFASSFNPRAAIPAGPVTVRQIAGLYIYDNELYAIEGTGAMIRAALENAARFFGTCPDPSCTSGPLIDREFIGYNYDMAQGVTYEIDLTQPIGRRIRNLRWKDEPLRDDQKLRIAVNNYRAGGSAGYTMFREAPVLWRSYEEIRELIIRYYADHKLPEAADDNWKIIPEAAHQQLIREVRQLSGEPLSK